MNKPWAADIRLLETFEQQFQTSRGAGQQLVAAGICGQHTGYSRNCWTVICCSKNSNWEASGCC